MSAPLRRQSGVVVAALITASSLTPAGLAVAAAEPELVEPLTEAELEAETGALIGDPVGGSVSPVAIDDRAIPSERLIDEAPPVVLPTPASFDVRLDELAVGRFSDGDSGSVVRVGAVAPPSGDPKTNSVPGSPSAVSVSVLDQQSTGLVGGQGLAFELVRADGLSSGATVRAEIDYSSFRYLYGGDWASRLRFAWYPDCTQRQLADAKSCGEPVWLPVENDVAAGRLFVDIPIDRAVKSFERGVVGPQVPGMTVVGDEQLGADQGGEVTWADLETADQRPAPTADGAGEQDTTGSLGASALARAFGRSGGFVMQSGGGGGIGAISGGQSGTSGSFTATGLAAAGKWNVGGASGNFSYSYPISVAPPSVGSAPSLDVSYSSSGVDGFTSSENTQGGLYGVGFDLGGIGFIERRYRSCAADGGSLADSCWYGGDSTGNATISLAGKSGELISTGANNEWRLQDDPFWKIQRCSSTNLCNSVASVENGDDGNVGNNEYWLVTTPDGTQYWFGYGQLLTGGGSNSVQYQPVYGNNTGEPCNASPGWCNQAYRWNLDRIVDPNGVVTQIAWIQETNKYGRGGSSSNATTYIRGAYPLEIDYGLAAGQSAVPGRIIFDFDDRCVEKLANESATCGGSASWPDTPTDLDCSGTSCTELSPSFYTKKRLDDIVSWTVDSSVKWRPVDKTQFRFQFLDANGTGGKLALQWLRRIGNPDDVSNPAPPSGYTPSPVYLPKVWFSYTNLASRADAVPFEMPRVTLVRDEMGSGTWVTYGQPNPCPSNPPSSGWDKNTWNCWNVWTSPDGQPAGWARHNKYLVTQIDVTDLVGGSPAITTNYTYFFTLSGADELYLWHHDNDAITPGSNQTWGDWRGYPVVITTKGATKTETRYFRGMHGDKNSDTTTKTVNVKDSEGTNLLDHDYFNGLVRETRSLNSSNQRISGSIHAHGVIAQTASMTMPQYSPRIARFVRETNTYGRTEGTTAKQTQTDLYWSTSTGMQIAEHARGDSSFPGDNRCTETFYTSNATKHIYVPRDVQLTSSSALDGCNDTAKVLQSRTRTFYDGANTNNTAAPTAGNPTRVESFSATGTSISTYTTYGSYGRVASVTDANNNTTSTTYSPTSNALTNSNTVTNPRGWTVVTAFDKHRLAPDTVTDANGRVTDYSYDGLGRTTSVKTPVNGTHPVVKFTYTLSMDTNEILNAPARVRSEQLYNATGSYRSSYAYYDGLGRERETQTPPAPGATGRTVVETFYDSRGLVLSKSMPFNDPANNPGVGLVNDATPPNDHAFTYDETERPLTDSFRYVNGAGTAMVTKFTTSTSYDGLVTRVTSDEGRKAETVADVWGNQLQARQLTIAGSTYATTTSTYGFRNELLTSTDEDRNTRTFTYNLLGRQLSVDDPDGGLTTMDYDANGNVTYTKDANNNEIFTTYDNLNRPVTKRRDTAGTGPYLGRWFYWDTTDTPATNKGQAKEVRSYDHNDNAWYVKTDDPAAFDSSGRLLRKTYSFPSAPGAAGLPGGTTFTYNYTYNEANQALTLAYPDPDGSGGLAAETVTTDYYSATGLPQKLRTNLASPTADYVFDTTYTPDGLLASRTLNRTDQYQVIRSYAYETQTRRLSTLTAETETAGANQLIQQQAFVYSDDGNIIQISDIAIGQRQCFTYDDISRLDRAWTRARYVSGNPVDCDYTTPNPDTTGPDPYDHDYNYAAADGGKTGNISSYQKNGVLQDFTYTNTNHPHAATTLNGDTYTYHQNGNLLDRTVGGVETNFFYYADKRLKTVNHVNGPNAGQSTRMIYDINGQRIARITDNPTGNDDVVLYVEGQEIKYQTDNTGTYLASSINTTRYYTSGGATVGLRNNLNQIHWMLGNHQGSASHTIQSNTTTPTTQRYQPFGAPRGATNQLPTDRDFLGQTQDDTTNLNYLNNRYYDPTLLHFTSVDPLIPQTNEPYAYSNGNPITKSDPTGLDPDHWGWMGRSPSAQPRCWGWECAWGGESQWAPRKQTRTNVSSAAAGDEALSLIAEEISTNRRSTPVVLHRAETYPCLTCVPNAGTLASSLLILGLNFKTGGIWDHKSKVDEISGTQDWLEIDDNVAVRWDVLSNLHYGYIMAYSGISLDFAIDSANIHEDAVGRGSEDQALADTRAIEIGYALCNCPEGEGDVAAPTVEDIRAAIAGDEELARAGVAGGTCRISSGCAPIRGPGAG